MDLNKLFIEKALYPAMHYLKGNQVRQYLRELQKTAKLPPEQLHALEQARLEKLLLHCIEHVPAYQSYRTLEPEIRADAKAALRKIEPLERSEFTKDPTRFLSDTADRAQLIENHTGGSTTGEPVKFYMDRYTVEHYEAARFRGLSWWGITPGSRSVMLWGNPMDLAGTAQAKYARRERLLKNRIVISAYQLYENAMADYVKTIDDYRPEFLYGYATPLNSFAEMMLRQGLRLKHPPKVVVSTSETLQPHYIENITRAFGCPVANEYGARDGGIIAYSSPCGHMHITAENACYEMLDMKTRAPVAAGETGLVAVTDYFNFVQPRLRYLLGDLAAVSAELCGCGITLPVMERLDGRFDDMFLLPDGRLVWSYIVAGIAKTFAADSVAELQVVQFSPERATLKYVRRPTATEEQIGVFLQKAQEALPGCAMEIECVESIPKSASGKTRYAIRKFDLPK